MKRLLTLLPLLALSALLVAACTDAKGELPSVTVYKTPTCGCCAKWVDHLRESGFEVKTTDLEDVTPMKEQLGVPSRLGSCHTAVVDGYVVEGHVPAEDVKRLIEEKPDVTGIAVPGMPIGSPGMEVEGRPAERYEVYAFDKRGGLAVFAQH